VLIPRHIATADVEVFMTVDAIRDLRDPDVRGPIAVDDRGRSSQTFAVHAEVTHDGAARSALATGRDIYATTAPVIVECMERVLHTDSGHGGVHAAGDLFDARDFLDHLAPHEVRVAVEAA
jgi:hypothetical protein